MAQPLALVATASGNNAHFAILNNGAGNNDFTLLLDIIDVG